MCTAGFFPQDNFADCNDIDAEDDDCDDADGNVLMEVLIQASSPWDAGFQGNHLPLSIGSSNMASMMMDIMSNMIMMKQI